MPYEAGSPSPSSVHQRLLALWRLREAGWTVHYAPEAVVRHEGGGSRRGQSARTSLLTQRAYVQLLLKHRPGFRASVLVGVALGLTVLKGMRRGLAAWLRGGRDAARESWRMHREELRWLARRWREPWAA